MLWMQRRMSIVADERSVCTKNNVKYVGDCDAVATNVGYVLNFVKCIINQCCNIDLRIAVAKHTPGVFYDRGAVNNVSD
jgi:hypothetical protein